MLQQHACLQNGEGKMHLKHDEHGSPSEKQAASTFLQVHCGDAGKDTGANNVTP